MPPEDDFVRLRAERDEWRRRAEVAEAIAIERLARAEAAERTLRTAEERPAGRPGRPVPPLAVTGDALADDQPRPATLRERWRRYTETIN